MAPHVEHAGNQLLKSVADARNAYIHVILNRSQESVDNFLSEHARSPLSADERQRVLQLMELERNTQLMYTSCGWFFDDISGIETTQIIAYACRVIELASTLFTHKPATALPPLSALPRRRIRRHALSAAKSNVQGHGGRRRLSTPN